MAQFLGVNSTLIANNPALTGPETLVAGRDFGGALRSFTEFFVYAAQASGSTIVLATIPANATFEGIRITTDTSTGSATLAFGDGTTAARFAAAAAYTSTDTPVLVGKTAVMGVVVSATGVTQIIATTASAALPSTGNLQVETFFKLQGN